MMQTADWRKMLQVTNSGTDTRPVRRSDKARLHSSKLVLDLRYFFFNTKTKTNVLTKIINTASTRGRTSALGSKYPGS